MSRSESLLARRFRTPRAGRGSACSARRLGSPAPPARSAAAMTTLPRRGYAAFMSRAAAPASATDTPMLTTVTPTRGRKGPNGDPRVRPRPRRADADSRSHEPPCAASRPWRRKPCDLELADAASAGPRPASSSRARTSYVCVPPTAGAEQPCMGGTLRPSEGSQTPVLRVLGVDAAFAKRSYMAR